MRWAIGFVAVLLCVVCGTSPAGEPEASEAPAVDLGALEMAKLMEVVRAELDAIESLKAEMDKTLAAIDAINGEVADLRAERLDQRLHELADRSPETAAAIQKLRALTARLAQLRADLQDTREAQRKLFDELELTGDEKAALRALLSGGDQIAQPDQLRDFRRGPQGPGGGPPDAGGGPPAGGRQIFRDRGGDQPDLAQHIRQQNERRREEYQRRLDALEQQDPELHALLVKKVELIETLDEPRVELAEHLQSVQRVLQELNRRMADFLRLLEAGSAL